MRTLRPQFAAKILNEAEYVLRLRVLYFCTPERHRSLRHAQMSLNNINPEANQQYSKAFFAFLKDKLGVEDTRGYM